MTVLAREVPTQHDATTGVVAIMAAGIDAHRRGALDEARKLYLQALERDPACADAWHLVGVLVQQMGDPQASIQFIARAIELSPKQAMYYSNLATALFNLRRVEEALDLYRQALALDPGFADAAYNMGNTLAWLERDDEAIQAYRQAITAQPALTRAHFGLGQLFFALNLEREAVTAYRRAVESDPRCSQAQFALGRSLLNLGDVDGSLTHYRSFKAALPESSLLKHSAAELLPLDSVEGYCRREGRSFVQIIPQRSFTIPAPCFDNPMAELSARTGVLGSAYVANIGAVEVLGWHDVIVTRSPRTVLYDMPTRDPNRALECEHGVARYVTARHALLDGAKESEVSFDKGLMLAGRGWDSYAHWVIDFLPRISLFERFAEYRDWPLLVDAGLYPQQMEALRRLVGPQREIHQLAANTRYRVEELAVASDLSGMRMQSYRPRTLPDANGAVVAPEALSFLRERILGVVSPQEIPAGGRRLYVSRRHQTAFRRLVNEPALEQVFVELGFEVIHPESLSFDDQVRLFSSAAVVAGAAGSNMINTVFCGRGTRILMLAMWHPRLNYHFFANIAQLLGHNLLYALGRIVARHNEYYYQSDFLVEPDDVRNALRLLDVE